jgi:biotin-dependent carboxylase-like uncharacterized protein
VIEIVNALALNTVQDFGRKGQRHIGVSTCGAMDAPALELGNLMVGNAADMAGIEVQTFPFEVRFRVGTHFAVTGADCVATLDGEPLMPWWHTQARCGQVLRLNYPAEGARGYLAIAGGIAVPEVLGSRSTDVRSGFGGFEGRFLKRGDCLALGPASEPASRKAFGVLPPTRALPLGDPTGDVVRVRVLRAGEYDRFPAPMQRMLWDTDWQVTHQSNRAGYRLAGPQLLPESHIEMRSYGVVPGLIQVPPGGQPIVQLSDANTAGGYPKIAAVIEADLWRLGQARPGTKVRFIDSTYKDALRAKKALDSFMAKARIAIAALQSESEGAVST